jgi:hypothetical protein
MRIKAIKCNTCNNIVYSRAEGDYRECACGSVGAFGGQAYAKYNAAAESSHEKIIINLDIHLDDLYNDWKEMVDVYGLINATDTRRVQQHIIC